MTTLIYIFFSFKVKMIRKGKRKQCSRTVTIRTNVPETEVEEQLGTGTKTENISQANTEK